MLENIFVETTLRYCSTALSGQRLYLLGIMGSFRSLFLMAGSQYLWELSLIQCPCCLMFQWIGSYDPHVLDYVSPKHLLVNLILVLMLIHTVVDGGDSEAPYPWQIAYIARLEPLRIIHATPLFPPCHEIFCVLACNPTKEDLWVLCTK